MQELGNKTGLYTDFYELTMAQGYYLSGREQDTAIFDYFYRSQPFDGGYVIFAGLAPLLETLEDFQFDKSALDYLQDQGFDRNFINYLGEFSFGGQVYAPPEGEVVFPNEPIVRVEGNIIETQLIETLLLNTLNYQSLIATKASRMREMAGTRSLADFGLRRAQGLGGIAAARAAYIGGIDSTSNTYAGYQYDIPVTGTQAHSWIQSFEDELTAFRTYARHYPDQSILLVDTYDTLESGVPNAIKVARELEEEGHQLQGIRLDSGDLAYLSNKARQQLDEAGLAYVNIIASNQLDEYVIRSLREQGAPIDAFGIGTRLVTGQDSPALDGVYKLCQCNGNPRLKISENVNKIGLPGRKEVIRFRDEEGQFYADGIMLTDTERGDTIYHPNIPKKNMQVGGLKEKSLFDKHMEDGAIKGKHPSLEKISEYAEQRLQQLNPEHKRFENPHIYKVGVGKPLLELRSQLIEQFGN